ncbi:MAG: glycosyltransferase family 4 protein [Alphaproteobacteria bacterium]|nr:MAG: glycosyltransferase family 4 protein [Alphaproteobacteria bacterium]
MISELRELGWRPEVLNLGEGFPRPNALTRASARARLNGVPKGRRIVIDGLAFGVMPQEAEALSVTHPLIALVHHPLALESGVSEAEAVALRESERKALSFAHAVVVNSRTTARALAEYGVPGERITVAPPGTDCAPSIQRHHSGPVALLAVGSIVPRKGYDVLVQALAGLIDLPWHLTIVGDDRDPATAVRLRAYIAHHKLGPRVSCLGAVQPSRLAQLYATSDLFVLPSRYEGFGMAYAEAIAHGLPVIGTTAGAIPDTVSAEAGVLIPPDDVPALAAALRRLIENAEDRASLAAGARKAAGTLPTWAESAKLFSDAIERVV